MARGDAHQPDEWQIRARGLLRAELARRDISQKQLVDRLKEMGIPETEKTVSNKLIRGAFSVAFLLQCCAAIDCRVLRLSEED